VGDLDLSEDGVAVVGEDDAAHGVEQHLQHGLGAEAGADDVGDTGGAGGPGKSVEVRQRERGLWTLGGGKGTYVFAAAMLDIWALRPVCRSPLLVSSLSAGTLT
jgi:hypothetical protein